MLNKYRSPMDHAHQFTPKLGIRERVSGKNPGHDKDKNKTKTPHRINLFLLNKLKIREHSCTTTLEAASSNKDRSKVTLAGKTPKWRTNQNVGL